MKILTIDLADTFPDTLAEPGTGLVHGPQDASDLQFWIEAGLAGVNYFQNIRDTFTA